MSKIRESQSPDPIIGSDQVATDGLSSTITGEHTVNENDPLISGSSASLKKQSQRGIGRANPEPVNVSQSSNQPKYDIESQFQNRLYSVHEKYQNFSHFSKWILNVMVLINSIWFVMTLISDFFFSIDVFFKTAKRSNNFEYSTLIFISIISNLLNLWFNKLGLFSPIDYTLNVILFFLTFFNLGLIYMIQYSRERMGFVSLFVYLWAAFSFSIGIILDWYLLHYNRMLMNEFQMNDEMIDNEGTSYGTQNTSRSQRLNIKKLPLLNNGETHTITEWLYIGIRNSIKMVILLYFALYTMNSMLTAWDTHYVTKNIRIQTTGSATYDAFHWVDENKSFKLHIRCYGDVFEPEDPSSKKQPIVIYEHGGYDTAFTSANWLHELYNLGEVERYCTYERPGYGLSDSAPAPESIAMVADSLQYALIKEANITGPFLSVGYDMGGLYAQVFAAKNLDRTQGLLLVESWDEELLLKNYLKRLLPPGKHGDDNDGDDDHNNDKNSSWIPPELKRHNEFKLWMEGFWATLGIKLQTSWLFAHHGSKERIFGKDMKYQNKFIRAKFLESITSSILSYRDVLNSRDKISNIRLSVVSSREMVKKSSVWGNWQRALTKISSKTVEWKIVDGGHEIHKFGLAREQTQEVLLNLLGKKN